MAVVIEERGGTAGVALVEHIVEEVVDEGRDGHGTRRGACPAVRGPDGPALRDAGPQPAHSGDVSAHTDRRDSPPGRPQTCRVRYQCLRQRSAAAAQVEPKDEVEAVVTDARRKAWSVPSPAELQDHIDALRTGRLLSLDLPHPPRQTPGSERILHERPDQWTESTSCPALAGAETASVATLIEPELSGCLRSNGSD